MEKELNMQVIKSEYEKLVNLYSQIEGINEDIKLIKDSIKLEGCNPAIICKIAQAAVKDKTEDIVNSAQDLIDLTTELS